ncbi:hypothetical protein C8Q79DRAFT_1001457 [Trametes meyenii]|nr:hypothetical protein C8Q79DRAFT_1001457 [Trametes meyenii]
MGFCFSCCRRRKRSADDRSGRGPLLGSGRYPRMPGELSDSLPPPKSQLEKAADVIAALGAGKLPSQEQVNGALRKLLNSDDDKVQDFLYWLQQIQSVPLHADVAVETAEPGKMDTETVAQETPSQGEVASDSAALLRSIYALLWVLVSSAAFRLILSEVLLVTRETAADVASRVGQLAKDVATGAAEIEETVRPGGGTVQDVKSKAGEIGAKITDELAEDELVVEQVGDAVEHLKQQGSDEVKEAVIYRLQEAMVEAHIHPSSRAALITIFSLARKYAAKMHAAAAAMALATESPAVELTPIVWADPPLAQALSDLKTLLERAASGYSLDDLLQALGSVAADAVIIPAEAVTVESRTDAGRLYDRARELVREAAARHTSDDNSWPWLQHARKLLHGDEADAYFSALEGDRTSRRLADALERLSSSLAAAGFSELSIAPGTKRAALHGCVAWLLPRAVRAVRAVPMPRVEFVNGKVEAAVDALWLTSVEASGVAEGGGLQGTGVQASLVPGWIRVGVESWTETVVEIRGGGPATRVETRTQARTRVRLRMEGHRAVARDVAYYVRHKGPRICGVRVPCVAYEDEGLVSVEVGTVGEEGTGLCVDVELELKLQAGESERGDVGSVRSPPVGVGTPLFRVSDVQSRHWILNMLVVLRAATRNALESVALFGGRRTKAAGDAGIGAEAWWAVLLEEAGLAGSHPEKDDEADGGEGTEHEDQQALVETRTRATLQGVVRTTIVDPLPGTDAEPEESVLAIGVGAQILAGKEGGVDPGVKTTRIAEGTREAAEDIAQAGARLDVQVERGIQQAEGIAGYVMDARARKDVRTKVEGRRRGWRSRVSDV